MACSPELGTTEGCSFKIDLNLLSSSCFGILRFPCVLKCMYNYKNNFLRNNKYSVIYGFIEQKADQFLTSRYGHVEMYMARL